MASSLNNDFTSQQVTESFSKATAYADRLNGLPKVKKRDVANADEQRTAYEALINAAFMYTKGVADNNRVISQSTSFAEFISESIGFRPNEKFGFSTDALKAAGLHEGSTLEDIARHSEKFTASSVNVNQGYRWLVPAILQSMAYQSSVIAPPKHPNWLAGNMNIGEGVEVIKPIVLANDAIPLISNEFQSITYATISFAQKTARFTKLEKAFELGRKQMKITTIPMLPLLTRAVMNGFDKAMDTLAVSCLLNGDQADLTEAAKSTGVTTANTLTFKDLLRIKTRSTRLGLNYNKMLTSENVALTISALPEFLGSTTATGWKPTELSMPSEFYPNINTLDIHGAYPSDNTVLFFDTRQAMSLLTQRPLGVTPINDEVKEIMTYIFRTEFGFTTHDLLARLKLNIASTDTSFHAIFEADALQVATPLQW